jgi:hypothetical protein
MYIEPPESVIPHPLPLPTAQDVVLLTSGLLPRALSFQSCMAQCVVWDTGAEVAASYKHLRLCTVNLIAVILNYEEQSCCKWKISPPPPCKHRSHQPTMARESNKDRWAPCENGCINRRGMSIVHRDPTKCKRARTSRAGQTDLNGKPTFPLNLQQSLK